MSVSDSEADFWVDLDDPPPLERSKGASLHLKNTLNMEYFDKFKAQLGEFLPAGFQRDRIYVVMDRIREAAKAEHEITLKTSLTTLHRYYKKKIHELSEENVKFMQDLRDDYDKLKISLTKKDVEILRLQSMLCTQEDFIARQRIVQETLASPPKVDNSDSKKRKENKEAFKHQITAYKDLIAMYHEQTDNARGELVKLNAHLRQREQEFNQREQELKDINLKQAEDYELLLKEQQDKFKKYTNDTDNELQVCHLVNNRQIQLLNSLQSELRSAKIVMQTPRLNHKYRERIKTLSVDAPTPVKSGDRKNSPLRKYLDRGSKVWKPGKSKI